MRNEWQTKYGTGQGLTAPTEYLWYSTNQIHSDGLPKRFIWQWLHCNPLWEPAWFRFSSEHCHGRTLKQSHQPIFPIQDLLHIEGAGGQEVPYLRYIPISINFPENITGKSETVDTLALVVPAHRTNIEVPLLIGTNTLDPLYERHTSAQDMYVKQ